LVILTVTVYGTGITITPPATSLPMHPAWNQLGTTAMVNSDFEAATFWHELGTTEDGSTNFPFMLSTTARASCASLVYTQTCLQSGTPCLNPVLDFSSGSSINSNTVTQSGLSSLGAMNGAIDVPMLGRAVGSWGTSDQDTNFGGNAPNSPNIPGNLGTMTGHATSSGVNGGIEMGDKSEASAGTDGPFPATLPQFSNPPSEVINSIMANTPSSGTATATTAGGDIRQFGRTTITATISGESVSAYNGTFTITPTSATTFTFPVVTSTNGTTGTVAPQDAGVGDNASVSLSLIPVLP